MLSGTTSVASSATSSSPAPSPLKTTARKLDTEQLAQISQLKAIDRHVRAHEQAHLAAAGPYALGGPSYTYGTGPDGRRYAIGGEVSLDTGPDPAGPQATIQKAKIIQAAANAPADPSTQDRMVAAQAARMEADAERQILAQKQQAVQAYQQGDAPAPDRLLAVLL